MPVMEEPDRHVEFAGLRRNDSFNSRSYAQPVALAQEAVVESLRLFVGPERIERTDVKALRPRGPLEFKENVNLFSRK